MPPSTGGGGATPPSTGGGGSTGGASSNGCYDLLLATGETTGMRLVQVREIVMQLALSQTTITVTRDLLVTGPATFEGHAAIATRQREAEGVFTDGIPDGTPNLTETFNYDRKTGAAEITYYGNAGTSSRVDTSAGITSTSSATGSAVLEPPAVLSFYSLPLGSSTTIATTYHFRSSSTVTIAGQAPSTTVTDTHEPSTDTIRFLRRESITVPAGTFQACVFETTTLESPGTTVTEWVADGKGFPLKRTTATVSGSTTTETTLSLRFNGQPVTP